MEDPSRNNTRFSAETNLTLKKLAAVFLIAGLGAVVLNLDSYIKAWAISLLLFASLILYFLSVVEKDSDKNQAFATVYLHPKCVCGKDGGNFQFASSIPKHPGFISVTLNSIFLAAIAYFIITDPADLDGRAYIAFSFIFLINIYYIIKWKRKGHSAFCSYRYASIELLCSRLFSIGK